MSRNSLLVWPVWLNGLVFVYDLSGCGFESLCCHFNMTLKSFGSNFCFIMNNVKVVGKELLMQYVNIPFKTRSYQYIPAYRQNTEIYGQLRRIQNPVKHRRWIFHFTKKFSIKDSFSKCDQIRSFLRIWSHLLKKSLMDNFMFCAVFLQK